jgi:hypothetical protein
LAETEPEQSADSTSLSDFVKDHHDLLTVLSVLFAVLGVLAGVEQQPELTIFLSSLLYIMALCVFYELFDHLSEIIEQASFPLLIFATSLALLMLFFFLWLLNFFISEPSAWVAAILVVGEVIGLIVLKAWKKYAVSVKIKGLFRKRKSENG